MAEVTARDCPHFRLHVIEVMQRCATVVAEDTAADMEAAGCFANGADDGDDLDALANFVHTLISDALAVGWETGLRREVEK